MFCVICGAETRVTNSRAKKKEPLIWRRRNCSQCDHTFTTREKPDWGVITVLKRDKSRVPFSRAKLFVSILKSLDHSKKSADDSEALTDTVLRDLYPQITDNSIATETIAHTAMSVIKRFDATAFVKYASYQSHLLSTRELKKALSDY